MDTCSAIELIENPTSSIIYDIIATSDAFNAPLCISSVTFWELVKDISTEIKLRKRMTELQDLFDFTISSSNLFNYHEKLTPNYWLKKETTYSDFKHFKDEIETEYLKYIKSNIAFQYFRVTILAHIFIDALDTYPRDTFLMMNAEAFELFDSVLLNVLDDLYVIDENTKDRFLYDSIISAVINRLNCYNNPTNPKPFALKSNSEIKSLLKNISNDTKLSLKQLGLNFSSIETLINSLFDNYALDCQNIIEYHILKHLVVNSPLNMRKFDRNDWIDAINISIISCSNIQNIIYHTFVSYPVLKWI